MCNGARTVFTSESRRAPIFFKGKGLSGSKVRIEFQPEKGKITEEKRQTNVVLFMFN